jgi:hypothetical protein
VPTKILVIWIAFKLQDNTLIREIL